MKTKPVTTSTGCQLNSAAPPSQPSPSRYRKTQTSEQTTATKPSSSADTSSARNRR